MSNHTVSDRIMDAWDTVDTRWNAEAKRQYYRKIYQPLLDESEGVYQRNEQLKTLGEECIATLRQIGG